VVDTVFIRWQKLLLWVLISPS